MCPSRAKKESGGADGCSSIDPSVSFELEEEEGFVILLIDYGIATASMNGVVALDRDCFFLSVLDSTNKHAMMMMYN
jgi:hypothetical protein